MRLTLASLFAVLAGVMLLLSLAMLARPVTLLLKGRRVTGVVMSEHPFRLNGTRMRFYRVRFRLSTGQEATLRSSASAAWLRRPTVGCQVPVLITESGTRPRAAIALWHELWLAGLVPLLLSGAFTTVAVFLA